MASDDTVLELARAIRPYLGELLELEYDPDAQSRATSIDRDLAQLLDRAQNGEQVDDLILDRLKDPPAVQSWAAAFLELGCPPDIAPPIDRGERGYSAPPGAGDAVRAWRFICPEGDMVFYRRWVGQVVPSCPTHNIALELSAAR
jgi:hypothetical protein